MHGFASGLGFILVVLFGMMWLRKLGWTLSRSIFYVVPWAICTPLLLIWGLGIAYGFRHFVLLTHPGWILKIIGYGAAMYVSTPNYGMTLGNPVSESAQLRHNIVFVLPCLVFVALSIVFAFTIK